MGFGVVPPQFCASHLENTPCAHAPHGVVSGKSRARCILVNSKCTRLRIDGVVCEGGSFMGQAIGKRSLVPKPMSIYNTSDWARKYRHDFEALQLSEEQVRLMWDEYCKVSTGEAVARYSSEI